jgi:hypothetical protein
MGKSDKRPVRNDSSDSKTSIRGQRVLLGEKVLDSGTARRGSVLVSLSHEEEKYRKTDAL